MGHDTHMSACKHGRYSHCLECCTVNVAELESTNAELKAELAIANGQWRELTASFKIAQQEDEELRAENELLTKERDEYRSAVPSRCQCSECRDLVAWLSPVLTKLTLQEKDSE